MTGIMQAILGLILAIILNVPCFFGVHPNGEIYTAVYCEDCDHYFIPADLMDECLCHKD